MPWEQASSNTFEREIGENETFFELLAAPGRSTGREHWAISVTASFGSTGLWSDSEDSLVEVLKEAWKQLRFEQPSIAAFVTDNKIVYKSPDATELQAWVKETFVVAGKNTTADDIIANRKPSSLAVLHYLPLKSQLVLQTSHWRTDGVGVFHILDVYLDLVCRVAAGEAASAAWGSEVTRLSPSIEEAAELPDGQDPKLISIAETCVETFALVVGQVGVKYQGTANTLPASTRTKLLQLSESETSAIITAAKARDLSVTSALHASVANANYAFAEDSSKSKPFTSTIRFGLRPYLSEQYSTRNHGSAVYTSGYMYQVPNTHTWTENATAFNQQYRKGYDRIMPAHRQYGRLLCDAVRNMPPPSGPPDSNIDISSVGLLDKIISPEHQHGDAKIEVVGVTIGVELLTRQMVCYVWTFRDRLNLQLYYNEAYHNSVEAEEILQHIRATTTHELGIQ